MFCAPKHYLGLVRGSSCKRRLSRSMVSTRFRTLLLGAALLLSACTFAEETLWPTLTGEDPGGAPREASRRGVLRRGHRADSGSGGVGYRGGDGGGDCVEYCGGGCRNQAVAIEVVRWCRDRAGPRAHGPNRFPKHTAFKRTQDRHRPHPNPAHYRAC